jgi:hypothetical protein
MPGESHDPRDPNGNGANAKSPDWPENKDRKFVDGAHEMTYENAIDQHVFKINKLKKLFSDAPYQAVHGGKPPFKMDILDKLDKSLEFIKQGNVKRSYNQLESVRYNTDISVADTFDEKTKKNYRNVLLAAVDDVKLAQEKFKDVTPGWQAGQYHPNIKIVGTEICKDKVWLESNKAGRIACVTPSTAEKLVARGWGHFLDESQK